jgi:hypothetical protein
MSLTRKQNVFLGWAITAGLLLFAIPVLLKPERYPSDDAFFYLQIAKNIHAGFGSTFHTFTPTNGYHPLWMLFCVAASYLSGGGNTAALTVTVLIQILLFTGMIYFAVKLNRYLKFQYLFIALPPFATFFLAIGIYGTEAHLHGFMLLASLYYFLNAKNERTVKNCAMLGISLALLFLARLDSAFLIIVICLALLWDALKNDRTRLASRLAVLLLPILLLGGAYLLYNYASYGHIIPISGAIKNSYPAPGGGFGALGMVGKIATLGALICMIFSFFSFANKERRIAYFVLGLGSLLLSGYIFLFTDHFTQWAWYYVGGIVCVMLVLITVWEVFAEKKLRHMSSAASLSIFSIMMVLGLSRCWSEYFNPTVDGFDPFQFQAITQVKFQLDVAERLRQTLPPHSGILMFDWPGMVAYYSDMNILPVDGLVNDFRYNDDIVASGIRPYLAGKHIRYWLGPLVSRDRSFYGFATTFSAEGEGEVHIYSPLYKTAAGSFYLKRANLVMRFKDTLRTDLVVENGLWRLDE